MLLRYRQKDYRVWGLGGVGRNKEKQIQEIPKNINFNIYDRIFITYNLLYNDKEYRLIQNAKLNELARLDPPIIPDKYKSLIGKYPFELMYLYSEFFTIIIKLCNLYIVYKNENIKDKINKIFPSLPFLPTDNKEMKDFIIKIFNDTIEYCKILHSDNKKSSNNKKSNNNFIDPSNAICNSKKDECIKFLIFSYIKKFDVNSIDTNTENKNKETIENIKIYKLSNNEKARKYRDIININNFDSGSIAKYTFIIRQGGKFFKNTLKMLSGKIKEEDNTLLKFENTIETLYSSFYNYIFLRKESGEIDQQKFVNNILEFIYVYIFVIYLRYLLNELDNTNRYDTIIQKTYYYYKKKYDDEKDKLLTNINDITLLFSDVKKQKVKYIPIIIKTKNTELYYKYEKYIKEHTNNEKFRDKYNFSYSRINDQNLTDEDIIIIINSIPIVPSEGNREITEENIKKFFENFENKLIVNIVVQGNSKFEDYKGYILENKEYLEEYDIQFSHTEKQEESSENTIKINNQTITGFKRKLEEYKDLKNEKLKIETLFKKIKDGLRLLINKKKNFSNFKNNKSTTEKNINILKKSINDYKNEKMKKIYIKRLREINKNNDQ